MQQLFAISGLVNFSVSIVISIFVFLKKRNHSNILFSILTLSTAIWSFGYWRWLSVIDNPELAIFWLKFLTFGSIWIPILFTHWISSLFIKIIIKKINNLVLIIAYSLGIFFSVVNLLSDLMVGEVSEKMGFIFWPNAGAFYIYYIVFVYFLLTLYTGILLIKYYKKSSGFLKNQIKYVSIGCFIALMGGVFNFFLWYDISIPPYGNLIIPVYPVLISYAIVKFRLMDIRMVITRSILYGFLVVMVAAFFAGSVFLTSTYLETSNKYTTILLYIVASAIVVVFLDPVKNIFARLTDKIFYKDRIDYQKLLQQASAVVAREIDLEKLSLSLCNLLTEQLKVKVVSAVIPKKEEWILIASSQKHNSHLKLSEFFIKFINDRHDFIVVEELIGSQNDINAEVPYYKELNQFIEEAEGHKIEMIVPVFGDNGQLVSIFLFSAKSSGDLYGQDDINFFKVLSPQIGTAIEKSKLYEEVQEFNRELQAKVDARTKSLKEANVGLQQRNKFLTAMQAVTNLISRTMDLKQVNQMIANSIALEFGYIGGILSFVDENTKVLRIGSMTENERSKEVIKILGQDPKNFEAEMNMMDLLGVKTVLSGQMNTSDRMSDFFSPPVDKETIDKVQEMLGVKTIVGLPIFSEDKIIGIIHFLLAVDVSKITSLDKDTMIALADQVGIVSRNVRLYNNLQATNQDLQVANMRLRELDQAKSEFLSIASHQLRTPISALKGYLSMISDGDFGTVPPKISKVVKDLFESAARLARLVNIFLNVSRIESGRLKIEKKPLQIGDMIESVIAELHNESDKKGVKLIYKKPKPALALVAADADKLREVVLNLIDNSIKYTPKGQIEVSAMVENENMHFKVQDTGIGIDPEEAKNLFRKFVRASGAAQIHTGGSGLGLFIAQKIIKEHGGQIWVESAGKEQGSIFQFVIPMIGGEPNKEEMQS